MNLWALEAMDHWKAHRPASLAALENPDRFFEALGEEASERYQAIRDGLLEGVSPKDGTITWAELPDRVAQADQTAREIVGSEMIFLPPSEEDLAAIEAADLLAE